MRLWGLCLALLLAGCAGSEIAVGAGREFGGRSLSASNGSAFEDNQDELASFDSFAYSDDDVDSLWIEWRIQLTPTEVKIVNQYPLATIPQPTAPVPVVIDHVAERPVEDTHSIDVAGVAKIGKDVDPWLVVAVAVLILSLAVGGYFVKKKADGKRKR